MSSYRDTRQGLGNIFVNVDNDRGVSACQTDWIGTIQVSICALVHSSNKLIAMNKISEMLFNMVSLQKIDIKVLFKVRKNITLRRKK